MVKGNVKSNKIQAQTFRKSETHNLRKIGIEVEEETEVKVAKNIF